MPASPIESSDTAQSAGLVWYKSAAVRIIALAATFTVAAAHQAFHLSALAGSNIWSHLNAGLWILHNHAFPRTGIGSQLASLPWIDASWGFDLLTGVAYRLFGLAGLPFLFVLLQIAVAIAFFALALGESKKFWPAVILAAVAQCCIAPMALRPALCSIVLLAFELALLLRVRRTADPRALFWLPLLFLLWANLDRQFSYGLMALALFCIAAVIQQLCRRCGVAWLETGAPDIPIGILAVSAGASLLATFVSPYGYRVHQLLWQTATNSTADRYFPQLHSMRFRQPQDYLLMLLAMTAFFALGRRRSRDIFLISLLIVSAAISFRMQRDAWLVAVVSVAIIGNAFGEQHQKEIRCRSRRLEIRLTSAFVLLVLIAVTLHLASQRSLLSKVSENFPVRAADYIRQNHLAQPLFNPYDWGGFLTWYLPEYPVYIDDRADLYGDEIDVPYFKLMQAEIPLQSHLGFAQAQTILLEANSPLGQALSTLPSFRVAYKDEHAVVLVRAQ